MSSYRLCSTALSTDLRVVVGEASSSNREQRSFGRAAIIFLVSNVTLTPLSLFLKTSRVYSSVTYTSEWSEPKKTGQGKEQGRGATREAREAREQMHQRRARTARLVR